MNGIDLITLQQLNDSTELAWRIQEEESETGTYNPIPDS